MNDFAAGGEDSETLKTLLRCEWTGASGIMHVLRIAVSFGTLLDWRCPLICCACSGQLSFGQPRIQAAVAGMKNMGQGFSA